MNFKDTLLICDLDGTLLDKNGNIDETSLSRIKNFCEKGGHFVICTGRMDSDIKYVEKKLGFHGEFRISQNGAVIRDSNDDLISYVTIPNSYLPKLNKIIFGKGARTEVSNLNNRFFPSPRNPKDVAEFVDSSIVVDNLPEHTIQKIRNVTIYLTFGDRELFNSIKDSINSELGINKVNIVETSPSSLEVFSNKASKGAAVKTIMDKLVIPSQKTYVVGDAESDTSMFPYSQHSFAVQEATEEVIEKATQYCKTVGDVVNIIYQEKGE